jgi:SET domain-containing protein 6
MVLKLLFCFLNSDIAFPLEEHFTAVKMEQSNGDQYTANTEAFLRWLQNHGVKMSPKMALVDLRAEDRGRGVGKFKTRFLFSSSVRLCVLTGPTNRCPHLRRWLIVSKVATADFDEDELVFSVPRNAVLNVKNVLDIKKEQSIPAEALAFMPPWLVRSTITLF